jgi:hypothetical protein
MSGFLTALSQKTKYGEYVKLWTYDYDSLAGGVVPVRTMSYDIGALSNQAQLDAARKFILDLARGSHESGAYGLYVTIYGTNPSRLLGQLWFSETQVLS